MKELRRYSPIMHTGFANTYTREKMKDFVRWVHDLGFSGFSMEGKSYPPTKDVDGWIESFINCVRMAVEEAEQVGVDAWLFDEWGYPTACAAGKTLVGHTEWRSKLLHVSSDLPLEKGQNIELIVPNHFISAAVWPVGRDIFGPATGPFRTLEPVGGKIIYCAECKRERLVLVTWEYDCFRVRSVFVPDEEDDSQGTVDILSHEAMDYFITQMHERYVEPLGRHFGKTLKGFFYDEPYLTFPYPYTFDLLEEFRRKKGYDIRSFLPQVLAGLYSMQGKGEDYRDVCTDRVAEAFYGKLNDWCEKHHTEMVGHQDLDHSPRTLDTVSGHFFKNMAKVHSPGVDYIQTQIAPGTFADFPRFAGSVRRVYNKEHAISESFAVATVAADPDFRRWAMEHQILRGIDRLFLMIADPDPEDQKFSTPVSIQHPQRVFAPAMNRRVAVTNRMVNSGKPVANIAIYINVENIFAENLRISRPDRVNVPTPSWEVVVEAAETLCYAPVDFEYLWLDAVLQLPLENGAFVLPGEHRIDTIIVPASPGMDPGLAGRLLEMSDQGGKVILVGTPPASLIGKGFLCSSAREIPSLLDSPLRMDAFGPRVILTRRILQDRELYFLLNEDDRPIKSIITFTRPGTLLCWDDHKECWNTLGEAGNFKAEFEPMELKLFAVADAPDGPSPLQPAAEPIAVRGWTLVLPDGVEIGLEEKLGDWREHFDPCYTGWMTYKATFIWEREGPAHLDLGRICHAARVRLDGREFFLPFKPYRTILELGAGTHAIEVDVLNTSANELGGIPERELSSNGKVLTAWEKGYLPSGLFGPVKLTPMK